MSQVAASCPRLPVEIWEEVLAYNLCDDHTLANCSLVCRTWSPTCRMHRFREIKVKPRPVGHPQAASLLCDPTSTVLPYVHSLTLIEGLPEMDLDRDDRDPITLDPAVGYTSYWFDDVLPKIRTRELTALERLSVQAIQWESLSSSSRKSVVDLCPRLRSLEVVTWDPLDIPCVAIIQLFDAATLLKHFTLRLPEPDIIPPIDPDDLPPPSDSNATLALESFQIDNAVGCYLKGLPFHFSTLCITKVTINGIGKNDVQALLSFITLCSASLQHLSLQLEDPYPIWGEVEDYLVAQGGLSCASSLQSLTVDARLHVIPSIVRQVTSPHLVDLTVKVFMTWVSEMYALEQEETMNELLQSLTAGALAVTRPRISFFLQPSKTWTPEEETSQIGKARDILSATLASLRDEGRLRIARCVVDPLTQEEIVEEL